MSCKKHCLWKLSTNCVSKTPSAQFAQKSADSPQLQDLTRQCGEKFSKLKISSSKNFRRKSTPWTPPLRCWGRCLTHDIRPQRIYGYWKQGYGDGSIPINTIFSGMNIHLPAILMFTRGTRFWPIHISTKLGAHQQQFTNCNISYATLWESYQWFGLRTAGA